MWHIADSRQSAEFFFGIARSREKILSAFTEAVKVTAYQKLSNKKIDSALCGIERSRFSSSNRITPRIRIYIQNRFSP
jgi:hypothetical protein